MFCKFKIFTLLLLILPMLAIAQDFLDYLGIEDGLSNNAVTSIYQDQRGIMWFGTYNGLNQYNGYEFRIFRNRLNDSVSLRGNRIVDILGDQHGRVWIGTKSGISIYDPRVDAFENLNYTGPGTEKAIAKMPINDLQIEKNGTMLIGTAGSGLLVLKKNEQVAIQVPFGSDHNNTKYHVQAVQVKGENIFVFIQGKGVFNLDLKKCQFKLITGFVQDAKCMLADPYGNLWIGNENGLFKYNIISKVSQVYDDKNSGLSNNHIHCLNLDPTNRIWIGTDGGGITIFDQKNNLTSHILPGPDKGRLKSGAVDAVFVDNENRTWIGTLRGGVSIVDKKKNRFKTISHIPYNANGLISDYILSFCEDPDGSVWVGADGEGISNWNPKTNRFKNYVHSADIHSLSNNNVSTIEKDFLGNIWIGTYGGGINRFDRKTNKFIHYPLRSPDYSYPHRNVWALFEDLDKNFYASTLSEGPVYILNRKLDRFEIFDKSLRDVIAFFQDENHQIWAGTYSTLVKLDPINKKHIIINVGSPVRSIISMDKGQLLIGTEGGGLKIFNIHTQKFTTFSEKDGLPDNTVLKILKDRSGNFWMSTFNGLTEFDPKRKCFKNFYKNDGLQSNQFNYNAGLRLSNGELLFGGIRGFNIFDPENIHQTVSDPKIILTALKINNVPFEKETAQDHVQSLYNISELTLPYDKGNLSFEFAALDYSSPEKKIYAYILDGWDKDWNYIGTSRSANYSRLTEGTYYLKIKTINSEGRWSDKQRAIKIVILLPWYRTIWAYMLYAIFIAGLIFGYTFYRRKQVQLKFQVKLANLAVEREKDLNEKKLSFFTHISHEFRTPLTLIISPIKEMLNTKDSQIESKDLIVVYRNARRMLSLVNQLLHFRKSEVDQLKISAFDLVSFSKEVYLCFQQQARLKEIGFEFTSVAEQLFIFADKEKIEIAIFNLLFNAFKYTEPNGKIVLAITETESTVELKVADTGTGIPKDVGDNLFKEFFQVPERQNKTGFGIGLYLVKSFVKAHFGKVSYQSEENKGTTFVISLLKGKNHFKGMAINEVSDYNSYILNELPEEDLPKQEIDHEPGDTQTEVLSEKPSILLIDDNNDLRIYLKKILQGSYIVYEADSGESGLEMVQKFIPNLVISDVIMGDISGLDFCRRVKDDAALSHIPIVLLTSGSSAEIKLKGIESGADDFITKPFDTDILLARISNLLKNRNNLQRFFYNHITFKSENLKVSPEYKEFLEKCIAITEKRITDPTFNIQELANEIGLSHSSLYKRVKSISGKSVSEFIRFIRLRKAAEQLINTDHNVSECAFECGFNDLKYFRINFNKLYGINPSDYILKYRKPFQKSSRLNKN